MATRKRASKPLSPRERGWGEGAAGESSQTSPETEPSSGAARHPSTGSGQALLPAGEGKSSAPHLWLRNEAGRAGVPLRRSFEQWVAAIPALKRRKHYALNILIVGNAAARQFNRNFRGRDYATNVLSFPYEPIPGERSAQLGDLVICAPVVAREAKEQGKAPRDHWAHLTLHGVLHLLGYDHERDADAEKMEALERRILATLGIADPYA